RRSREDLLRHHAGKLCCLIPQAAPSLCDLLGHPCLDLGERTLGLRPGLGDQTLLLRLCATDDLLKRSLRLSPRLIESRGMLRTQSFGLGLDRTRFPDCAFRTGLALPHDPERRSKPEAGHEEPERDEDRDLNQEGVVGRYLEHVLPAGGDERRRCGYLATSECTLCGAPSPGRSSFGKSAILRSFSVRNASGPPIAHWPSNTTPSWMTRLGVAMLPKSFPGARISRRFCAVTSPVTRP